MGKDSEIIVIGSHAPGLFMRVKRIPHAGETVIGWDFHEPKDGGKGSNQAISTALLGGKVSFVGCVGKDRVGQDGERWMMDAGVDTTWLRKHDTVPTSVGFILLDDDGIPAMVSSYGANAEITREQIDQAYDSMVNAKVMLTQFEIPIDIAMYATKKGRELGLITIVNPAPATKHSLEDLNLATLLVPNEAEAKVLLGIDPKATIDFEKLATDLKQKSRAECVIVTLGEKGAIGIDQNGVWKVSPPIVKIIDTSGAGDVFCAALAVAIVRGDDFQTASNWACHAASLSVRKPGTIPSYPTLAEINQFLYS